MKLKTEFTKNVTPKNILIIGCIVVVGLILIFAYWDYALPIIILIICGSVYLKYKKTKKLKELREKAIREKKEAEEIRKQEIIKDAEKFLNRFNSLLTECLIIDSNIWMDLEYDYFFNALSMVCNHYNYKIVLYGPQFDEIINKKKKTDYGDEGNKAARIAINRIERFQTKKLLYLRPITINADPNAYADPLIIKLLIKNARDGICCTLLTEDKELRIRARQFLSDNAKAHWKVLGLRKLLDGCKILVKA